MIVMPKLRGNVRIKTKLLIKSLRTTQARTEFCFDFQIQFPRPGIGPPNAVSHLEFCFCSTDACRNGGPWRCHGDPASSGEASPWMPHTCASFRWISHLRKLWRAALSGFGAVSITGCSIKQGGLCRPIIYVHIVVLDRKTLKNNNGNLSQHYTPLHKLLVAFPPSQPSSILFKLSVSGCKIQGSPPVLWVSSSLLSGGTRLRIRDCLAGSRVGH